jgi:hypothetical protein
MAKINFTEEHKHELDALLLKALYNDVKVDGKVGTTLNVYDLVHNTSITTLSNVQRNLKKSADGISELDEWSMTDYQQRKQKELESNARMVFLLIGYKRYQEQIAEEKKRISELKDSYKKLKEDTKTPEVRLQEMESQLLAAGVELN